MNIKKFIVAPFIAAALLVTGCSAGGDGGGGGGGDAQNVLRIGTSTGIDSMNPFVSIQQDAYSAWMQIYPSLLQYDTTDEAMPYRASLAQEWEMSEDGLTATFNLVEGAQWSDGEPLDADSVAWSFGLFKEFYDTAAAGWSIGENIDSIVVEDPQTVVFNFVEPSALSLYSLATTPILPKQVWEAQATDADSLLAYENLPQGDEPMVSGGPFMLTQYKQAELAIFTANPNWYGETPSIDGFGLQAYKAGDAMVSALESGNIDAIFGVPPTAVESLEEAGATVETSPALILRDFIINSNPDKPEHRELLNLNVRKALEHAVNRQEIVDTAWLGMAIPGDSLLPPTTSTDGVEWYNDDLETVDYDLDAANKLLDAEGFEMGGDGVRIANGHPMEYDVVFANDESGPGDRAFQIMKSDFEKIGIVITQRKLDPSAAWEAIYCGEDCEYRDFDFAMWDWYPAPDPNFLLSSLVCSQWGDWNDAGYCNPEYDELQERAKNEVDPAERKVLIDQMQQKIYDERPYIILTYDMQIDAWSSDWEGLITSPQGFFNNFSTQSLEQAHRK